MDFFDTEKYTLIPYEFHSTGKEREILSSIFDLTEEEDVRAIDVPDYGAAFLFASIDGDDGSVPSAFGLLEKMESITETHKISVRFSDGLVTVCLTDRDHLLLLCSYRVMNFTDALYYIFLAMRDVKFEPDHSALYWCGSVSDENLTTMKRYFEKIVEFEL
ncbi:MAG: DUF3822 family protein [Alistipes sp.]|nr:DUF3822 family protein [Candidatus Minthomonas equi]